MAAAVSSKLSISNPFQMTSHKRADPASSSPAIPSSSRLLPPSQSSSPSHADPQPKTFKRLRSSLEQSIRTATKSKSKLVVPADESGILAHGEGKGKERAADVPVAQDKSRSRMLSKVSFRRPAGGKDASPQAPALPPGAADRSDPGGAQGARALDHRARAAVNTSFQTPSLRQASMSSPALPIPSMFTQSFALPSGSSSNVAALVSPPRDRSRRSDSQAGVGSREISGPTPLTPRRDVRATSPTTPSSPKTRPPPLILSRKTEHGSQSPVPVTPTDRMRSGARSPESPTPGSSRRAAASASHLPLSGSPTPPSTPPLSPSRVRSSSRTPTHRVGPSASSSHLPLASSSSSASARRPSIDAARSSPDARRPSIDARRPSVDARRPSLDARKPSLDLARSSTDTRRPSLDQQRSVPLSSTPSSRAASPISPSTPTRARAVSPPQRNYSPTAYQNRGYNASTTSLVTSSNPESRELIRSASSFLCKEMLKPSQLGKSSLSPKESEEIEVRMRGLARLERVWGKSGVGMNSSSQLSSAGGLSSSGLSASGEEREKRLFSEALKDGYVLCQLMNKLFPGSISRIDPREDGLMRTSNIKKFLAACSSVGVHQDDLFGRDDLIEASVESLARVARSLLALQPLAESPRPDSRLAGRSTGPPAQSQGPYSSGAGSRSTASTPNLNLAQMQRSTSPVAVPSPGRRRWSPPQPLPTLRSNSPIEEGSGASSDGKMVSNDNAVRDARMPADSDADDVPPIMSPPPRSPLRPRASVDRASMADSTRASLGDSARGSIADSVVPTPMRMSQASSNMTDSTMFSSLLEVQRTSSAGFNKFGTIRTVTTEATSVDPFDPPSMSFTEGSSMAASFMEEFARKRSGEFPPRPSRERRPSETAAPDLTRVVEETEEGSASSKGAKSQKKSEKEPQREHSKQQKSSPINLGKGKWPDDFLDAFKAPKSPLLDDADEVPSEPSTPLSSSPRKIAIVGTSQPDASAESLPQFPRRPTHRSRHSLDAPVLLPKPREASPDTSVAQSSNASARIMLRRNSTKNGPHRNGIYIPRSDSRSQDSDSRVPFPRAVSGDQNIPASQLPLLQVTTSPGDSRTGSNASQEKPRQPRGRFQSEIDGSSSRRKARPNSYDDAGAQPRRSRFESMVNLGVVTSNASASDLLARDSQEGSAVRKTLIVREDGKPPTQFQLGNCIGRGQFGAVYRALNLNTGQMVAVKRIRLEGLKEDEIGQLMKEVDLVKSLSHPSIVKYEGMARDEDTLNIVLEYAENGSLGQTLKAFGKLNERLVAGYVVKILEGLHYLHQSDVVHCDLKAANILTTKNGNVKLSDFGVSLNLRAMERELNNVAGTPNWMAPEVIELKGASPKSDIWSLACTVIELLTGRPPYADITNSMSVMFRIVEDKMPPIPDGCSETLRAFLKLCFNKDPAMRPSAESLCEHEWLKQNWAIHNKELRPQDSIPFLRRVSADYQNQRPDVLRYLANSEAQEPDRSTERVRMDGSPARRRMSNDFEPISSREHSFVRSTFGKPVICRVCNQTIKRSAVLCEQCTLICHVKCSPNAAPTCDFRAQLLLYAQYAESGGSSGQYSDPMELLAALQANGPSSPISDGDVTPRTSMDSSAQQSPSSGGPVHSPSAYRVLQAFKRSKSFLMEHPDKVSPLPSSAPSPVPQPASPSPGERRQVTQKRSVLRRKSDIKERPLSMSSSSTAPHTSSVRSTATNVESLSSSLRQSIRSSVTETDGRDPHNPVGETDKSDSRFSQVTGYSMVSTPASDHDGRRPSTLSGDLPKTSRDKRRDRDSKSSNGGCSVQ